MKPGSGFDQSGVENAGGEEMLSSDDEGRQPWGPWSRRGAVTNRTVVGMFLRPASKWPLHGSELRHLAARTRAVGEEIEVKKEWAGLVLDLELEEQPYKKKLASSGYLVVVDKGRDEKRGGEG